MKYYIFLFLEEYCDNTETKAGQLKMRTSPPERGYPLDIYCEMTCSLESSEKRITNIGIHISPNDPYLNPIDYKIARPQDSRILFEVNILNIGQNKSKTINNQSFLQRNAVQNFTFSEDGNRYSLQIRIKSWTEYFIKNNIICSSNFSIWGDTFISSTISGKFLLGKISFLGFQLII